LVMARVTGAVKSVIGIAPRLVRDQRD
jgi:hypothetical protein